MTQHAYWKEVKDLARAVSQPHDVVTEEYGEDDIHEILHQAIENQVIYYHDCLSIMTHTDSPDAYWDQMGEGPQADSWFSMLCPLAFYAMMEDVTNHSDFDPQDDEDGNPY